MNPELLVSLVADDWEMSEGNPRFLLFNITSKLLLGQKH